MSLSRRIGVTLALIGAVVMLLGAGVANATGGASDEPVQVFGDDGAEKISGGTGDDDLFGAGGSDTLSGKAGDDFIEAADMELDVVRCGPGDDLVNADETDDVAADCETVYRS